MVVILAAFSAWLLPRQKVHANRVNAFSAVWNEADLVLERDFFMRKAGTELDREKKQILLTAPLVFEENTVELKRQDSVLNVLKQRHDETARKLLKLLDTILNTGIIEEQENIPVHPVLIFRNGIYERDQYDRFFTLRSAINCIQQKEGKGYPEIESGLLEALSVTYIYSPTRTRLISEERINAMSLYSYYYPKGSVLIRQGEPLNNEKRFLINNYIYQEQQATSYTVMQFMARWAFVCLLFGVLLLYLFFFRKPFFGNNLQFLFLFLCLFVMVLSCHVVSAYNLYLYALPYVMLPMLVRVFYDSRTALFTYLLGVLLAAFFQTDKLQFTLIQLCVGIITLFSIAEIRRRTQLINAFIISLGLYVFTFFIYQVGFEKSIIAFKLWSYLPFIISSVLLLLSFPLIYSIEKVFRFSSDFTLLELSDLNHPLLRELSDKIPGTFQHSLQVANLAEEAIYYIGGNTLLVRTGALFHDIGKLKNGKYFIENQGNNRNPHEDLEPEESAAIIIGHIITGIEVARQYQLPESIIDFIRTHHGTTSVGYFLNLYKKVHGDRTLDEQKFRYPGPIPFSKETAVLMLADGVEAASRSLKVHDALTINDLVDKIIDYKIQQNQLINSDITFKDITLIRKIFKRRLMNIYHVRIEYPR